MTAFRAGQPVMWGELPFVVTDAADYGTRITSITPFDGWTPDDEGVAFTGEDGDVLEIECAWFALCDNTATSLQPHPILGPVPICDRCRAKVDRISGARSAPADDPEEPANVDVHAPTRGPA